MPTAPVDANGTVLYYEDCGAPEAATDYTTLVLIHGTCFHSAVFRPMIPFAADHNLRLVLLNLRGYPGSTPYSPVEQERLAGDPDVSWQTRGVELAAFVRWFIEKENIPPAQTAAGSGKVTGGLSLLSWSGGNCTTLAMFAHADKVPAQTRDLLGAYLRSFVLYDASSNAVGSPPPPGVKNVIIDRTALIEDQAAQLGLQVGSYYPVYVFPNTVNAPPESYPARVALQDQPGTIDPRYIPTTSKMSADEFRGMTHPPIMDRIQHLIWSSHIRPTLEANLARALYDCRIVDDGSGVNKKAWPAVRVHAIWCDMTLGEAAWAAAVLHHGYQAASPEARRPMEMHKLEGVNHFFHWEEPEKFVKFLAGIL